MRQIIVEPYHTNPANQCLGQNENVICANILCNLGAKMCKLSGFLLNKNPLGMKH